MVEKILNDMDEAAWVCFVRVALDTASAQHIARPVSGWPPAGEIQACRHAADGAFNWGSLYPRDDLSG